MHRNRNKSEAQVDKIEPDAYEEKQQELLLGWGKNIEGNQWGERWELYLRKG